VSITAPFPHPSLTRFAGKKYAEADFSHHDEEGEAARTESLLHNTMDSHMNMNGGAAECRVSVSEGREQKQP
jgi:hypothetical protein